jgi:hypothetical protein
MVNTTSVMDKVTLIYPTISVWSGTARVRRDKDLANVSGQLPPSELISDGVKHLVESKELAPLVTVRKAVQRELEKLGIPMCGGFLVLTKNVQKAMLIVDSAEKEFDSLLGDLITRLPDLYAEQEARFPEWAELLNPYQISGAEVQTRCSFAVAAFKLSEPTASAAAPAFRVAEGCVVSSLLDTIAKEADRIRKTSFLGVDAAGQRPMRAIRDMVDKLESFSFVDARVYPICVTMRDVLGNLPKTGSLSRTQTATLDGMLAKLSDPATVLEHGQAVLSNQAHVVFAPITVDPIVHDDLPIAAGLFEDEDEPSFLPPPSPQRNNEWNQSLVF